MPMVENGRKNFIKMVIALYILKILQSSGPTHGNKMADEIRAQTNQIFNPNPNSLYPLLRLMEERGYVTSAWASPDTRNKRIYDITACGLDFLPELEEKLRNRIAEIEDLICIVKRDLLSRKGE